MNCTDIVAQCYWAIGASRNVGHLSNQCMTQLHPCKHWTGLRKQKIMHVLYIAIPVPRPYPQKFALIHDQLKYRLWKCIDPS
jgi:hypothetical protein